ncbi:MAG: LPS assembly lipoprotein LptE [Thermoguttaceae bacterium]
MSTQGKQPACERPHGPSRVVAHRLCCALFLVGAFILLSGCAAYHIGNNSLYPVEVHSVYVPMFESVSFRRNLGERLTEAVMKEIELKTPYKVVADPNAESILSGRIVEEGKNVLIGTRRDDPRELQTHLRVQVSWVDRRGKLLRESPAIPLPSEIVDVQGTANVAPEVGQSIASAQQQAIQRVAEQIVSLMEKPW